ncbi:DNA repair protein RecO [Paenisporosarcina cavernae]|uniref:DNA repair protein RecO n=1 Tax=Paenisporosarcina cavernae TaxID=2320858 RepID=A0A385YS69_9BACL|nr:DNA repair protein RecO [Paenisporosarcina cavernae]AYC29609.1 DNA repair protein RecO [Paenisporosarcina cavernae]
MLHRIEGIVIKTRDYGETNKIVTVYTKENGKITAMARGAKKAASRLSAITQLFSYGSFLIQKGSGMGTIQQGELLESYRFLREDFEATAYASYIVEIMDRLTEEERPSDGIYHLLLQALHAISEKYDPEAIALFVEWKMLQVAGIYPMMTKCTNCGASEGEFAFSFQQIGLLCHRCFEVDPYIIRLTPTQLKLIRLFMEVPIEQVGKLEIKKETKQFIKKIVRTIYDEQTGLRLKSRKFLDQIDRTPDWFSQTKASPSKEEKPDSP